MVTTLPLICEMDLMDDAIRSLSVAMGTVGCRDGAVYRDYERRLTELLDSPMTDCAFVPLCAGRIIVVPPDRWRMMVDEGREIGVI